MSEIMELSGMNLLPAKPLARANHLAHASLFARVSLVAMLFLAGCATDAAKPLPPVATAPDVVEAPSPAGGYSQFLAGQQAAAQGDLTRAADLFERASSSDPNDAYLRARAFSMLLMSGQVYRAASLASANQITGDDTITGLAALSLAINAMVEGRGNDAIVDMSDKTMLGPHSVAAALLKPWAAALAGDWKVATAPAGPNADKIVVAFGGLARAQLLERAGRAGDAEAVYKTLSNSRETLFVLAYGSFLERRGRAGEAVNLYNQTLARSAGDITLLNAKARAVSRKPAPAMVTVKEGAAQVLINLAALLVSDHQTDVGLSYLRLALRLDPERADAWVLTGETLAAINDTTGSRAAYLQVKPSDPSYPAARVRLALSYQQAGDKAQALKIAQDANSQRPGDQATEVVYAELLRDSDRFDDAIKVLTAMIDQPGQRGADGRLYYLRGANEERSGHWPEAEADLRKSLKLAPNEADVLNYLGFAWVDRGEHLKEALDMLQRAVALAPDSGAIIDSLGWARYRLNDFAGAARDLERAVYLDPSDPEINDHLGDAYWRVGRRVEATYQWRHVLVLKPDAKLKANVESKLANGLPDAAPVPTPLTPAGKGRR